MHAATHAGCWQQLVPAAAGCCSAGFPPAVAAFNRAPAPASRVRLPACSKTGEVLGWYFDPSSSPDQKLDLCARRAGPAGWAFPHYELA